MQLSRSTRTSRWRESLSHEARHGANVPRYLDSVIHFAYVLLRMLERYSKNNAYMYVRKRKAARRKRKILANDPDARRQMPEEYDGEGEGEDDAGPDKDAPSFKEHNFTFQAFEMVRARSDCHGGAFEK